MSKLIKANIPHYQCWGESFETAVCIFRLVAVSNQPKHSEAEKADTAASTEDATPAQPAAILPAGDTFPAAVVSHSTL